MTTHTCKDCGCDLSHRPRQARRCAPCVKAYAYVYNKALRAGNPGGTTRTSRKWVKANPEKHEAHKAVTRLLRNGTILRQRCTVCGDAKADAHHDSYKSERWLDVVWLCRLHHKERHRSLEATDGTC